MPLLQPRRAFRLLPTAYWLLATVACAIALVAPAQAQMQTGQKITPPLSALRARLAVLEKRAASGRRPVNAQNLALWRVKIEQARLWLNDLEAGLALSPDEMRAALAWTLDRAEAVERAPGDAAFSPPSQMHERAYIAQADGSAQPYWIFVPRDYSPQRKYPLVVFLHGYDPALTKAQPWLPGPETWSLATERGFLFAVPYGRRNTDFLGVGEDDTLAMTADIKQRYSVDAARVFLSGASMGGYGALVVGLHHPQEWTALSTIAARSDIYLWLQLNREQLAAETPWKLPLYEADDPRRLKNNALHLPIFLQHGAQDTVVDPAHSRLFASDLQALGAPASLREIEDGDHYVYWKAAPYETLFNWLLKVRPAAPPRRVSYTTATLRNHRAYWASIEAFQKYGDSARLQAAVGTDNVITVETENVAAFTLRPPAAFFEQDKPITLRVNGQAVEGNFDLAQPIRWPATAKAANPENIAKLEINPEAKPGTLATAGEKEQAVINGQAVANGQAATKQEKKVAAPEISYPGIKTPQRSGPIRDCYRDPFLLVYGTAGDAPARKKDEAAARRFAQEWQRFADGVPPLKADRAVTAADRKNYNLILFGTRASNVILAGVADRLPVELTPAGYRLNDKNFEGKNLGLVVCYPSPFDARRLIIVQSGLFWGDALPINHKFDLQPDYIVFDDSFDITDGTNRALAAGFFDGNWRLQNAAPLPLLAPAVPIAPTPTVPNASDAIVPSTRPRQTRGGFSDEDVASAVGAAGRSRMRVAPDAAGRDGAAGFDSTCSTHATRRCAAV